MSSHSLLRVALPPIASCDFSKFFFFREVSANSFYKKYDSVCPQVPKYPKFWEILEWDNVSYEAPDFQTSKINISLWLFRKLENWNSNIEYHKIIQNITVTDSNFMFFYRTLTKFIIIFSGPAVLKSFLANTVPIIYIPTNRISVIVIALKPVHLSIDIRLKVSNASNTSIFFFLIKE